MLDKYELNEKLTDEEILVSNIHNEYMSDKELYFIPWSKKDNFPFLGFTTHYYMNDRIDLLNKTLLLDKLYKVNKKNIWVLNLFIVKIASHFGFDVIELKSAFNKVKYFRFKRSGEIEFLKEDKKESALNAKIFLQDSLDYMTFHKEHNFQRMAVFNKYNGSNLEDMIAVYFNPEVSDLSVCEENLYKKFLNEYELQSQEEKK